MSVVHFWDEDGEKPFCGAKDDEALIAGDIASVSCCPCLQQMLKGVSEVLYKAYRILEAYGG